MTAVTCVAVYEFAAELLGLPPEELEAEVEANFLRLLE
jgi:Tat protein secretion system quality control protein TatD with DNase activity